MSRTKALLFESDGTGQIQEMDSIVALGETRMSRQVVKPRPGRRISKQNSEQLKAAMYADNGPRLLNHLTVCPENAYSCLFSDDTVYTGGSSTGTIYQYDLAGQQLVRHMEGHRDVVRQLEVLRQPGTEDVLLYSVSKDKTCRGWEVATGQNLFAPVNCSEALECLTVGPRHVVVGTVTGNVRCLDRMTGALQELKRVHSCNIKDMIIHEDRLYTCSLDGLIKCVDLETFSLVAIFQGMGSLRCLGSYNVDLNDWQQSMVLTGSSSGELGVYDTRTSRCVMTHQGHADAVLCITPHRAQVWTGGDDCAVCQWDMREARLQHTYTGMGNGPKAISVEADQERIRVASMDGTVSVWPVWSKDKHGQAGAKRQFDDHDDGLLYLDLVKATFKKHAKGIDEEGGKVLTPAMWRACLKTMDCVEPSVVELLFHRFDDNGDQTVGLDEVLMFLEKYFLEHKERTLKQCFNVFDANRSGDICATEVSQMAARGEKTLTRMGITNSMLRAMLDLCKAHAGGEIDFREFKHFAQTRPQFMLGMFPCILTLIAKDVAKDAGVPLDPASPASPASRTGSFSALPSGSPASPSAKRGSFSGGAPKRAPSLASVKLPASGGPKAPKRQGDVRSRGSRVVVLDSEPSTAVLQLAK